MQKHLLPFFAILTGVSQPGAWSKGFRFTSSDPQTDKGTLLVSLSIKSGEEIDLQRLGTQLINSLHENYYRDKSASILQNLKKALAGLPDLILEIIPTLKSGTLTVEVVAAVIWGQFLYLGKLDKGEIYLKRDKFFGPITFTKVASGRLQNRDWLFLANQNFWDTVSKEQLKEWTDLLPFEEVLKKIDGIVGNKEDISCTLAFYSVEESLDETDRLVLVDSAPTPATTFLSNLRLSAKESVIAVLVFLREKIGSLVSRLLSGFWQRLRNFRVVKKRSPKEPTMKLRKRGKTWRIGLLVIIVVLTSGLFLNFYLKKQNENKQSARDLLSQAQQNFTEAMRLQTLNTQKARELLAAASEKVTRAKEVGGSSSEIAAIEKEILDLTATLKREYRFAQLPLFYDLGSLKRDAKVVGLAFQDDNLVGLDANGSLLLLDLKNKKGSVLIEDTRLKEAVRLDIAGTTAYILKGDKVYRFDLGRKEFLSEINLNMVAKDISVYADTLYFTADTLRKGVIAASGGITSSSYLATAADLGDERAVTVDGFVWVANNNTVFKLSRGQREDFSISGLEKPLNDPTSLTSTESSKNLYILDRSNQRVVAISKSGSYYGQYISPQVGDISAVLVDEAKNRLYLAGVDKIYVVEIEKGD